MTEKTEETMQKGKPVKLSGRVVSWGVILVVVTGLVAWFAFAAVYGVGIGTGGNSKSPGGKTGGGTDYIYLRVGPGVYNSSMDQFSPANFTVPAHTLLVFVITNYDNGENTVTTNFATVSGTVGNLEYLNGSSTGVSSVKTTQVSHTISIVGGTYGGFNVPIPAAKATLPTVVQFQAFFNTTGAYVWNCMAPCDKLSMGTPGFMTGTMTVV